MKHTPGPWTMEPNEDPDMEWEVNADDGQYIADIIGGYALEQVTADARLIAAAPELLEACVGFLKAERIANEHGIDGDECHDALMEATSLARSAIAKATETESP